MAEEFNEALLEEQPANPEGDIDMAEGEEGEAAGDEGIVLPFAEGGDSDPRTTFISYLTSPVVTLIVGSAETETILTAHQALLVQSPFFADACAAFADDGSVSCALIIRSLSPCAQLMPIILIAATCRARGRGDRRRWLLSRVPVHRRLLSQKTARPAPTRDRSLLAVRRRDRRAAP
jgi:hypothetical protein